MSESDDKNALVYLLAGFGLGAIVGAAAGVLFAPKAGTEVREDLGHKLTDLKGRTKEWVEEQKAKRVSKLEPEELGA
ncbi:MAG: YtxH domain-containing protein [Chthonomonas sp.]|nr:YtxH domain-containing protein [Chthonomonas sp.]